MRFSLRNVLKTAGTAAAVVGAVVISTVANAQTAPAPSSPTEAVLTPIGALVGEDMNAAASITVLPNGATTGAGAVSFKGNSVSAASGKAVLTNGYGEETANVFGSGAQVNAQPGDETTELGIDGILVESQDEEL